MHPEPSFPKKRDHSQRRPPFPKNYSTHPGSKEPRRHCSRLHPQAPSSRPTALPPLRFGAPGRGQRQMEQRPAPGFAAPATAWRREPHNRSLTEWRPSPSSAAPRPEVTSRVARGAAPRERRAEGGVAGRRGAGRGRGSVSGGCLRSLTPAAATLSRGCFLHPGIFWSLHPGSSKVPGPKTGSKCGGTYRSGPLAQPLRPVRPGRPLRRPWLPPAGRRGRGRSSAFAQWPRRHAAPATSFAGPCGRWRSGPPGRRPGAAASRRRRKMAAG